MLDEPGRAEHVRFGASRDVDGVLAEGEAGPLAGRFFSGRPKIGDQAQGIPTGVLSGAQGVLTTYRETKLGAAYARFSDSGRQSEYATGFLDFDPLRLIGVENVALPLYLEHARKSPSWEEWWKFKIGSHDGQGHYAGHALKGSLTDTYRNEHD